jgi:hypothetical protein
VSTTLNQDGHAKTATYSVSGSINGSNVSLQIKNGMAGLLGMSTILVGSLRGQSLTLSKGNSTLEFHKVSDRIYQEDLAGLNTTGQHVALVQRSTKAMQEVVSFDQGVDRDLQHYLVWGQTRISRVPGVRDWYTNRINHYTACLNHIRPLAAAHVPVWQWQECALGIETDKYYRDQQVANVKDLQEQDQQGVRHLYMKLGSAKTQFASAIDMLRASCPYRLADTKKCYALVRQSQAMGSYGFINKGLLSEFQTVAQKVTDAINEDVATSSAGHAKLSGIAQQVSSIYRGASGQ